MDRMIIITTIELTQLITCSRLMESRLKLYLKMELSTKVNGLITRRMGSEFRYGQTVLVMKDFG